MGLQTATRQQLLDELFRDQLPRQGEWSAEEYLWLTDYTRRLIEFTGGYIEVLPIPTIKHQLILRFMLLAFMDAVEPPERVLFAALRLYLDDTKYREPDLLLSLDADDPRNQDRCWHGADLVRELVSDDDPDRDLIVKRREYAGAGIPEYWIVNPLNETTTVLTLRDGADAEHGIVARGQQVTSLLIPASRWRSARSSTFADLDRTPITLSKMTVTRRQTCGTIGRTARHGGRSGGGV